MNVVRDSVSNGCYSAYFCVSFTLLRCTHSSTGANNAEFVCATFLSNSWHSFDVAVVVVAHVLRNVV